ncbi:MAG: hypothetical protein APF80_00975 [Alphaproteobacteria bacterium BRH_c36]|nr:MAG: hypothetical protein APF80_00975 [Alphaproteobacteria bacterium BRH_c36]
MTYDTLILIQTIAQGFFLLCVVLGTFNLIAGLIKPAWVRLTKRRWVVSRTFLVWLVGLIVVGGAIGYTHSHPQGPHAFNSYIKGYIAAECAAGTTTGSVTGVCEELKQQCAVRTTFPPCETYHAERKRLGLE